MFAHLQQCFIVVAITVTFLLFSSYYLPSPIPYLQLASAVHNPPSECPLVKPLRSPSSFPLKIWQTAKVSLPELSADIQSSILTWTAKNPFHRHEILTFPRTTTYARQTLVSHKDSSLLADFLALQDPILRADLIRYILLYSEGGVYADTDTHCLRPIEDWIPAHLRENVSLVLGIEGDSGSADNLIDGFSYPVQFASWTIFAKPGHPILNKIIDRVRIQLHTLAARQNTTLGGIVASYMDVIDTTGPGVFSGSIYEGLSEAAGELVDSRNLTGLTAPKLFGDVLILPITAFAPGMDHSGSKGWESEEALVGHLFAGSWKNTHMFDQKEGKYDRERRPNHRRSAKSNTRMKQR